jgi:hypothetical protein
MARGLDRRARAADAAGRRYADAWLPSRSSSALNARFALITTLCNSSMINQMLQRIITIAQTGAAAVDNHRDAARTGFFRAPCRALCRIQSTITFGEVLIRT